MARRFPSWHSRAWRGHVSSGQSLGRTLGNPGVRVARGAAGRCPAKHLETKKWGYSLGSRVKGDNNNSKHLNVMRREKITLKSQDASRARFDSNS